MQAQGVFSNNKAIGWRVRVALGLLFVLALFTVWFTNSLLTDRFTQTTRNRAELRITRNRRNA